MVLECRLFEGQECFCWLLTGTFPDVQTKGRLSFFILFLIVLRLSGFGFSFSIFFSNPVKFKMLAKIHVYNFLPKMMKVTKTKKTSHPLSHTRVFYLISF